MTAPTLPPTESEPSAPEPRPSRWSSALDSARGRVRRPALPSAPWLMGLGAAAWACVIGLGLAVLPMLVVWMATPASGLTWPESLRIAGLLWLVAQGTPITLAGVSYSLVPLGLVVIPLVLLGYAGGWATRRAGVREPRAALTLALPGIVLYSAVAAILAVATFRATSYVGPLAAAGCAAIVATLGLGWGTLRASGIAGDWARALPLPALVLRAGVVAAAALMGIGALAATVSLVRHMDDAITMAQSLHAGLGGGLGLLAAGIAYVPVAAIWGAAYVSGAGVVIGPAVTASPFIAVTPPTLLPPFPLLAALPQTATPFAWALPVLGIVCGVLAGLVIARGARGHARLVRVALAAAAAAVAGAGLAACAALASGSLGNLRLDQLGPSPTTVGVLAAVLIVLGAAPMAAIPASPERPRLAVANPGEPGADGATVEDTSG